MLPRLALDFNAAILGVLDGGSALVDERSKRRRSENCGDTGATGANAFSQSSLLASLYLKTWFVLAIVEYEGYFNKAGAFLNSVPIEAPLFNA